MWNYKIQKYKISSYENKAYKNKVNIYDWSSINWLSYHNYGYAEKPKTMNWFGKLGELFVKTHFFFDQNWPRPFH